MSARVHAPVRPLDLSGTEVTDKGATALAAKDSGLKALTTLDLSNTPVGDAGAAALAATARNAVASRPSSLSAFAALPPAARNALAR